MAPMLEDDFRYIVPEADRDPLLTGCSRFVDMKKVKPTIPLDERLSILADYQSEINNLKADLSTHPEQIFVVVNLNIKSLDDYGINTENFKNRVDRENVARLRSELSNIIENCLSILSPDQIDKSTKCIHAFLMQESIQRTNYYLSAYREYEQNKTKWERIIWKHKRVVLVQQTLLGIISAVVLVRTLIISIQLGIWHGIDEFVFSVLVGSVSYGIFTLISGLFEPQEYSYVKERYKYVKNEGNIEDAQFWQDVKDRYGGLPTDEQLEESWNEQQKIITVFEEPLQGDIIDPD